MSGNITMQLDKLKKLSAHMLGGNRYHDEFSFDTYSSQNDCGTCGCMAGELPQAFPGEWKLDPVAHGPFFEGKFTPHLTEDSIHVLSDLRSFFGFDSFQANHLFMPKSQLYKYRHDGDCRILSIHATLEQVVENLDSFILLHDESYKATYDERWSHG